MKVLYLSDAKSIHTIRWVEWARDFGHDVHVVSFRNNNIEGTTMHLLPSRAIGKLGYLLAIPKIRKIYEEVKPNIVHAHYATSYGFLAALARLHPLVISAWGSDVLTSPQNSLVARMLVTYAFSKAESVTTVAEHMNRSAAKYTPSRIIPVAIPMGIDLEKFPFPEEKRDKVPPLRIISTRAFKPIYDIESIIRAVGLLSSKGFDIQLDLIGDGPLRCELEAQANRSGLQEIVAFHGKVKFDQLKKLLGSAHVFVSSSHSDGNNVSLNEAMALGCYPVATNIPANSQWIEDGINGLLFRAGDSEDLADKLAECFKNWVEFAGVAQGNRKLIAENANWNSSTEEMQAIYKSLSDGAKSHA
jgi:glycosyltransferase involved in cell wall biosynthesis